MKTSPGLITGKQMLSSFRKLASNSANTPSTSRKASEPRCPHRRVHVTFDESTRNRQSTKIKRNFAGLVRRARHALSVWPPAAYRRSRKTSALVIRDSLVRHVRSWELSARTGTLATAEPCSSRVWRHRHTVIGAIVSAAATTERWHFGQRSR